MTQQQVTIKRKERSLYGPEWSVKAYHITSGTVTLYRNETTIRQAVLRARTKREEKLLSSYSESAVGREHLKTQARALLSICGTDPSAIDGNTILASRQHLPAALRWHIG